MFEAKPIQVLIDSNGDGLSFCFECLLPLLFLAAYSFWRWLTNPDKQAKDRERGVSTPKFLDGIIEFISDRQHGSIIGGLFGLIESMVVYWVLGLSIPEDLVLTIILFVLAVCWVVISGLMGAAAVELPKSFAAWKTGDKRKKIILESISSVVISMGVLIVWVFAIGISL